MKWASRRKRSCLSTSRHQGRLEPCNMLSLPKRMQINGPLPLGPRGKQHQHDPSPQLVSLVSTRGASWASPNVCMSRTTIYFRTPGTRFYAEPITPVSSNNSHPSPWTAFILCVRRRDVTLFQSELNSSGVRA